MKCNATQGRQLIALLKRRRMSYMDMLMTRISVSPWKRIAESLKPGESLNKALIGGRTYWSVRGKA